VGQGRTRSWLQRKLPVAVTLLLGAGMLGGVTGAAAAASDSSAGLAASFATVSTWNGGYTADFTVTNHGTSTTNGWTLVFDLPKGALIVGSWNGTVGESGSVMTVTNASYNGKLAPGASATFGYQAADTGSYQSPTGCTINGAANCSGIGTTSITGTGTTTTVAGTTTTGTGTGTGTTATGTGATTTGTDTTTTGTTTTVNAPPPTTAALSSNMAVTSDWGSGYNANFVVTNNGSAPTTSWTLTFQLPAAISLSSYWSGDATVSGSTVTVTNAAWNGDLAPGASATFGAQFSGGDLRPTSCTIGGSASQCTIGAGGSTTGGGTTSGGGSTTGGGTTSGAPGTPPICTEIPGSAGSVQFAPYVDVTLYPEVNLANTACDTGIRDFTIAFFTGNGCIPQLATSSYENPELQADITNLRSLGGDAIGSFGGEAGQELAESCANVNELAQAYEDVINYYGFTKVDFDIEGSATGDNAGIARRVQAVQLAEQAETAAGHPFAVSLTLPVLPTGLPNWSTQNELGIVQSMAQVVPVSVVNIMTMDYGESWPSPATSSSTDQMGNLAIQAADATETELAGIFPNDTSAQLWKMIGVTPLIGVNDQADEVFTPGDATQVANWAATTGIGRLAFWSLTKDAECPGGANEGDANTCSSVAQTPWEFSDIFETA
jgi:Cellulose binding domain/Glycosyl hydrolases family 18